MDGIELKAGTEQDLEAISQLSQTVWGYALAVEHLRWRYFQHPLGPCPVTIAVKPDTPHILGFYAAIPVEMQLNKDRIMGAQVIDTMAHPDAQGKGLFGRMADHTFQRMADAGIEVIYGFPNENAYTGCINRLNWHHTGQLPLWLRPLQPLYGALSSANALLRYWPGGKPQLDVKREQPESAMLDGFWKDYTLPVRMNHMIRNAAWLNWRYAQANIRHFQTNSRRAYYWHSLYNTQGQLAAYGVWGILDNGPDASLCELYALDADHLHTVLNDMIAAASEQGLRLFRAYCQQQAVLPALKKAGFIRLPARFGMSLIVRGLTAGTPGGNIHQHRVWQLIGGDLDTQ